MGNRYLFNVEEELDEFQINLSEHIGPAAYYIDTLWLAERLIELFFYSTPFGDINCVERFLEGFTIPSEKLEDISKKLKWSIEKKISQCIPDFSEKHAYSYKVTSLADVIVDDLGLSSPVDDAQKDYLKELNDSIANGDYIPERYRRLVS